MEQFMDRLTQPQTIISAIVFVFSLWTIRATLNSRIKTLEEKVDKIDKLDLDTKIAKIMTDLERIKWKFLDIKK